MLWVCVEIEKIYGSSKLVSSGPWGRKAGPESLCGISSSGSSSGSSGNSGSQWLRNLEEEKRKETTQERKRKTKKSSSKTRQHNASTMPAARRTFHSWRGVFDSFVLPFPP